ncbi:hypothetical protein F2981_19985 (plasmid) [Sinorhizobium meliloti]|nr:hypothetical protein [Sinorhizobium meliloti]
MVDGGRKKRRNSCSARGRRAREDCNGQLLEATMLKSTRNALIGATLMGAGFTGHAQAETTLNALFHGTGRL